MWRIHPQLDARVEYISQLPTDCAMIRTIEAERITTISVRGVVHISVHTAGLLQNAHTLELQVA